MPGYVGFGVKAAVPVQVWPWQLVVQHSLLAAEGSLPSIVVVTVVASGFLLRVADKQLYEVPPACFVPYMSAHVASAGYTVKQHLELAAEATTPASGVVGDAGMGPVVQVNAAVPVPKPSTLPQVAPVG